MTKHCLTDDENAAEDMGVDELPAATQTDGRVLIRLGRRLQSAVE